METFIINRIPHLLQLTGIIKRTWSISWYEAGGAWCSTSKTDLKSLHSSAHGYSIAFPEVALLYSSGKATGTLVKWPLGGNEVAFSCQSWSCKSYPIRSCKLRRCHFRNYKYISYSIFAFISALPHSGTIRHNVSVDLLSCTVIRAAFFSRDQGKKILIIYFTIWLFYLKSATESSKSSTKLYNNKMPSQIFSFCDKTLYFWYFTIWIIVKAPPFLYGLLNIILEG